MPAGASCWGWTSSPGGSTAVTVGSDGELSLFRQYWVPGTVGAIVPVEGDEGWMVAAGRGFVLLCPDGWLRPIVPGRARGYPDERRRL